MAIKNITIEIEEEGIALQEERFTLFSDKERVIGKTPLASARFISKITDVEDIEAMAADGSFHVNAKKAGLESLAILNGYKVKQCGVEFTTKDLVMVIEKAEEEKKINKKK